MSIETALKGIVEKKFNTSLIKTGEYDVMDFKGDDIFVEIKSRNVIKNAYPDTMIGLNKILFAQQSLKKCIFIFSFKNGDFYWEFDKGLKLRQDINGRCDRGCNEYNEYCYIPVSILKEL